MQNKYNYNTWEIVKYHLQSMPMSRCLNLAIKFLILLVILSIVAGCTTTETQYIDSRSEQQARAVISSLDGCTDQPLGIVGDTNKTLVQAYVVSTVSLKKCQAISGELQLKLYDIYIAKDPDK